MEKDKQKELIIKFGTSGQNMYVHVQCKGALLDKVKKEGNVIQPDRETNWGTQELIGLYKDISHCDVCGVEFQPTDAGYYSCWVTSPDELALWEEIKKESSSLT